MSEPEFTESVSTSPWQIVAGATLGACGLGLTVRITAISPLLQCSLKAFAWKDVVVVSAGVVMVVPS